VGGGGNGGLGWLEGGRRVNPGNAIVTAGTDIAVTWPLQDIVSLCSFYVGVNPHFIAPPRTCITRTIAILLHVYCARHNAPPTPPLYAIHYTILIMAISCKGQAVTAISAPGLTRDKLQPLRRWAIVSCRIDRFDEFGFTLCLCVWPFSLFTRDFMLSDLPREYYPYPRNK